MLLESFESIFKDHFRDHRQCPVVSPANLDSASLWIRMQLNYNTGAYLAPNRESGHLEDPYFFTGTPMSLACPGGSVG